MPGWGIRVTSDGVCSGRPSAPTLLGLPTGLAGSRRLVGGVEVSRYGIRKCGLYKLMLIGSKGVKSTAWPAAGNVNGNLFVNVWPVSMSTYGFANEGALPVGKSFAPAELNPNGGAPKFCSEVSSSVRL